VASSQNALVAGVAVFAIGTGASRKKTPAITLPQVREIFSRLLQHPAPTPADIAAIITQVLRRSEEVRIYHWHALTQTFPALRNKYG